MMDEALLLKLGTTLTDAIDKGKRAAEEERKRREERRAFVEAHLTEWAALLTPALPAGWSIRTYVGTGYTPIGEITLLVPHETERGYRVELNTSAEITSAASAGVYYWTLPNQSGNRNSGSLAQALLALTDDIGKYIGCYKAAKEAGA